MKLLIWDFTLNKVVRKEIKQPDIIDHKFEKRKKSGLRKCPGHKYPTYEGDGHCLKCGGWKYEKNL